MTIASELQFSLLTEPPIALGLPTLEARATILNCSFGFMEIRCESTLGLYGPGPTTTPAPCPVALVKPGLQSCDDSNNGDLLSCGLSPQATKKDAMIKAIDMLDMR